MPVVFREICTLTTLSKLAMLFTPSAVSNIPYLLCRQIVRDHGEATNRRGCAIKAEVTEGGTTAIVVTLPRVNMGRDSGMGRDNEIT